MNKQVWENITFPHDEGETSESLEFHLNQILKFIADEKPSFNDVNEMFETANWDEFIKAYPDLDVWEDTILKATLNKEAT